MSITQKLVFYKIKILIELFSGIADFLMVIFDIFFLRNFRYFLPQ